MDELQRHHAGSFLPDAKQLSRYWFERSGAPAPACFSRYSGAFRGHRRTAQRSGARIPAGVTRRSASAPDPDSTKLARWPEFYLLDHAARARLMLEPSLERLFSCAAPWFLQARLV